MKNEKTSIKMASLAGKILSQKKPSEVPSNNWIDTQKLAGSVLTQTLDKDKSFSPKVFLAMKGVCNLKRQGRQKI